MRTATLSLSAILALSGCSSYYFHQTPLQDNSGNNIVIVENPYTNMAAGGYLRNKNPIIGINPFWMMELPEEALTFVIYHEYAHFRLNHQDHKYNPEQMEYDADCLAGKILENRFNYTEEQMEKVYEMIRNELSEDRYKKLKMCLERR